VISVVLYILVPVALAQLWRVRLMRSGGGEAVAALLAHLHPVSLAALLVTLVLLFGFQGRQLVAQPLIIAMLAVPILVQVYFNSALATVVGVLIEVPVMLSVVPLVGRSRAWYERKLPT
jgi:ACR3 family arsenite transporter